MTRFLLSNVPIVLSSFLVMRYAQGVFYDPYSFQFVNFTCFYTLGDLCFLFFKKIRSNHVFRLLNCRGSKLSFLIGILRWIEYYLKVQILTGHGIEIDYMISCNAHFICSFLFYEVANIFYMHKLLKSKYQLLYWRFLRITNPRKIINITIKEGE